jgi:VanZ family protein
MKKSLNKTQVLNAYAPPIIWAGLIFFLSAQSTLPGASYPLLDYIFKQSAHVFVYAVLHFLIWRAIKITTSSPHNKIKILIIPIILSAAYAFSDELHQSFIPGRKATLVDIGFDSIGIIISHYLTHRQKQIHSDTLLNW